jgi:DNA-3-methyladenine glycosylase I
MDDRCPWCGTDPLYVAYHDEEWGVPERDPRAIWESLVLEGFQAGLSWITILRKREGFRAAFDGFDPHKIARWTEDEVACALADPGIVRHRGKIEATVVNARAWLALEDAGGFERFIWARVDGVPLQNRFEAGAQIPAQTPLSADLSKALKAKGFKFCGPTTVYAFMQAVGMVNDHLTGCRRHDDVARLGVN